MFKHPRPILIVDDDVELVTLLVDYLQLEGFAPVAAHNGTEALELLSRQEFEIVVLDVMMPGMSGVEVLKRIREKSQLPVLMLTAKGDPVDRIRRLRSQALSAARACRPTQRDSPPHGQHALCDRPRGGWPPHHQPEPPRSHGQWHRHRPDGHRTHAP